MAPGPSAAGSPSHPVCEPVAEAAVEGTPGEQPACHEYQEHPDSQPSPGDLWKAAWCFYDEGDPDAERWVRDRARAVLDGQAAGVLRRAGLPPPICDRHLTEALLKSMRRLYVHCGASITPETDLLPQ